MSIPQTLTSLVGEWAGVKQLWLDPNQPAAVCAANASVSTAAQGQFLTVRYTWSTEGQPQDGGHPQDGLLLLGSERPEALPKAVWLDSWHMANQFMICAGESVSERSVAVKGAYAAPPGPDWGWRITVETDGAEKFRLIMHNIMPDGVEALAVLVNFTRRWAASSS